jgi:hypothetical protein
MLSRSLRRLSTQVSQVSEPALVKSAESASLPPPPPPASAPAPPRDRSGFRSRLASFFVGVAVTSLFGYVKLKEQVVASAERVDSSVQSLLQSSLALKEHVDSLEKRLKEL